MVASKQSNQAKNTDPKEDKIELWPIEKVLPYPKNQKKHPDDQVEKIANSIREFGFNQPIVIEPDGTILAGHGRRLAAMKLGLGKVPVTIKKLTPPQAKAYRIADNKTNESDWDYGMLKDDFFSLRGLDFDLSLTAFDPDEINKLLEPEALEGKTDSDYIPDVPTETKVARGDLFILGNHRLLCGDSTNISDVEKLMAGDKADMVFTDPPYGVDYEGGHNQKKRSKIKGDSLAGEELTDLFGLSLSNAEIVTHEHAAFYIWFANGKAVETFASFAKLTLKIRAVICWYKIKSGLGAFMAQYIPNYEPCIYAFKSGCSPQWFGPTDEKTVWELKRDKQNDFHPTQKPVELVERAINNSSLSGQIVLDLFGGSGATMIGAEKIHRRCFMMELDPKYCFVILRRWAEFTGEDPMRVDPDTGELTPWYP